MKAVLLTLAFMSTAAVACHSPPGTLTVTTPLATLRPYASCRISIDASDVQDADRAVDLFTAYLTDRLGERKTCRVPPHAGDTFIVLHIKVVELEKTTAALLDSDFRTTLAVMVLDGSTDELLAELVATGDSMGLTEREYGGQRVDAQKKRLLALRRAGDEIMRYLATRA